MARILVTGAGGFTGRYLVSRLAAEGHEVHGLLQKPEGNLPDGLWTAHSGSLLDVSRLREIIARVRPQSVVHLAAIAFVAHGSVEEIYQTNIVGTRALLQALVDEEISLDCVLLASSANVYGNALGGVLGEETPVAPTNDYAVSKLAMEYVSSMYRGRLPMITVRPFNYTGVGQSTSFIIPKIVDHIRKRLPRMELGNLDVARDFSDVRVVVEAYARLLSCPAAIGETFNICSGSAYSLGSILDLAQNIGGHELDIAINPLFVRANEVRTLCGDKARFESVAGPLTPTPIEDLLRWMIEA